MRTQNLIQGTPEWHAHRAQHDNASDASAMMGVSSYKTRDDLIAERATGITPEVNAATQRLFDSGHRFEALARPLAEAIIGEDLSPVTGSQDDGRLSASFDGLTVLDEVAFEHKRLNERLRAILSVPGRTGADLPLEYQIQMEQQCAVSGCEKVLFMASAWADDDALIEEMHCWYTPNLELRAKIVAGWEQLHKDVAEWVAPKAPAPKIVAEAVTTLPAVFAQVTGSLALKDNLPEYEVALRDFIDHRLIRKPETDQDFANLDLQIKALKGAEAALEASEEQALSQAEMLSAFKRQKDMLHALTRDTRLAAQKLLEDRKEQIKLEQVQRGQQEFAAHIAGLNASLGKPYMPTILADFANAIKGKRTADSLRGAVNDELARAKIAADEVANRIQRNLGTLRELAGQHVFLFADTGTIVLKACDDLTMLVKSRIAEHDAKEAARLEAERERIRNEEAAKLQREAEAKARAETAELARQQDEARAQLRREDQARMLADANAAAAAQAAIAQAAAPAPAPPAQQQPDDGERINLGAINAHFAPIKLDAAGLAMLGFEPVATAQGAKLYHAHYLHAIRITLMRHLQAIEKMGIPA